MTVGSWTFTEHGGGRLIERGSALSTDGRFMFVVSSDSLRVFNVDNRIGVRNVKFSEMTVRGDFPELDITKKLVRMLVSSDILHFVFSDGHHLWLNWKEFMSGDLELKVEKFQVPGTVLDVLHYKDEFYTIIGKRNKGHNRQVVKDGEVLYTVESVRLHNKSLYDRKIVFLTTDHKVTVIDLETNTSSDVKFSYRRDVMSVAVAEKSDMVALGTATGIIHLVESNTERLLKWHIDQVKAMEFTVDEMYLVSGGVEKVLVFWNLSTGKQQFLPRLNGVIVDIDLSNPELYTLTLISNSIVEFLVISSIDLASRISVASVKNRFKGLNKKKSTDKDVTKLGFDITTDFEVVKDQLFFPLRSQIQVYDYIRNEQQALQTVAPVSQIGKVRSELAIQDPKVKCFAVSENGKWMCTFDSVPTPSADALLSTGEQTYSLKFWKHVPGDAMYGSWELTTKIIDPHAQKPVSEIIPAPSSLYGGDAFVSVDGKGNVRLWRPRALDPNAVAAANNKALQHTEWTLRKAFSGFESSSESVHASWSPDGSIIALSHETNVLLLEVNTSQMDPIPLPSLVQNRITGLKFVDDGNLLLLTKRSLANFNILTWSKTPLNLSLDFPAKGQSLVAVDQAKRIIAVVLNYYNHDKDIQSKVYLFKADSLVPIGEVSLSKGISGIRYSSYNDTFVVVDTSSMIFTLSNKDLPKFNQDSDYVTEINTLVGIAQSNHKVLNNVENSMDLLTESVMLNANSFDKILENTEGLTVTNLFERVLKVI
ncbi:U3 snoRNP protein [Komagataella phaffii CBS 7435]|uniref:U3 snoRNP protein, component of the small (Ribosomal) subunit (SSU) processosome containing U3 snoRN n=2 Tax=Komagataella phaffii TaxID=460519 RepID=C4R008_KOMPG|nr:U3 snoRNP protein, component of the small (ribosomal) subunit (SSU) processosome containing U3 snoRN [Komagataella phaffii GS115]AOA62971.1 GQ67_00252T0 [Komagataella phaffii]CAH2448667.1 U3 snoRNP protein [Komagataella phaffii CBS 7435]AOA67560.1 GQ68_01137T0 [Komagataella phaffii GS115]CAY68832.1 U3 snoRNP protein, component of the small (ribosomal) subunit (SSU) processosome containing U3 snoRN [Komagataella phaffii GS115]CCA38760.1 U3 snoRNP protein [Komagataella phaffii CBS 7435]